MSIPYTAPPFSLRGTHRARIVGVHDGDTVKCVIGFNGDFYTFSVRVYGIDTPEMTSKDPSVKAMAIRARNRLIELVTDEPCPTALETKKDVDTYFKGRYTEVQLDCLEMDKYGRVLANIGRCADILVNEGLAHRYFGKTKEGFE